MKLRIWNVVCLRALIAGASLLLVNLAAAQAFMTLHNFSKNVGANNDGGFPQTGLISSGNVLYGTTVIGGTNAAGIVYAVNTDGSGFTNLHNFSAFNFITGVSADGSNPEGALVLGGNTLYGTTVDGGPDGGGTIFSLNTNGTGFIVLHPFPITVDNGDDLDDLTNSDGAGPAAGLILSGSTLYGTAASGGTNGTGTVFKLDTSGGGFTVLHTFASVDNLASTNSDGAGPFCVLVLAGNTLYGTTARGGTNGNGVIFAVNTDGSGFTNLYNFIGNGDGVDPVAGLVLSGNMLFGTTEFGGAQNNGTVFGINTNGTGFTNFYSFTAVNPTTHTNIDGANPNDSLIVLGNTLYGTTFGGGSSGDGALFSINTDGTGFTNLYSFTATDPVTFTNLDGANLYASLVAVGSTLYGTAGSGGTNANGTVFGLTLEADLHLGVVGPVLAGNLDPLVYNLTIVNFGPNVANGVVVSNQIPFGTGFTSATGGATPVNGVLFLNIGSLASGQSTNVSVTITATNGFTGDITNLFLVTANEVDPGPTDNSVAFVTQITAPVTQFSTSTAEVDSNHVTTVSEQVTNFSTELIAKLPNGTVVFDQTFSAPLSDSTVQAAITTAAGDLAGAGASSFTGPTQTSSLLTTTNSSVDSPTTTNLNVIVGTKQWVGPVTFPAGDFGIVSGYTFDTVITNYAIPIGGTPTPFTLPSGHTDFDTMVLSLFDFFFTTTNTATVLNTSVFTMTGVVTQTDLSLSAVGTFDSVMVGSNLVYSVTVSNAGPSVASGVVISDEIPTNFVFVSATGGATPSGGTLLVNVGSLGIGAVDSIQIVVQPTLQFFSGSGIPAGQPVGELTNTFQVSANETDPVSSNNSATVISSIIGLPIPGMPLTISGSPFSGSFEVGFYNVFGSGPIQGGVVDSFTTVTAVPGDLVVLIDTNGGFNTTNWAAVVRFFNPVDLTGTNGLPATDTRVFFATNFGGAGFDGFQLFPNAISTVASTLPTVPTNSFSILVTGFTVFGTGGAILAGQTAFFLLTAITPLTDLSLGASAPGPVAAGDNLVYTITVSNAPNAQFAPQTVTATGVVVSNQIPDNVTFVSATDGAVPSGGVLLLNLGSLPEGTNTSVQVIVHPTGAGTVTNSFQVFANEIDQDRTNNATTLISTVTNAPVVIVADLKLSASAVPEPLAVGSNLVYSILVTNQGPSGASGVIISNRVPATVNFVSATGGSTPSGGILIVNCDSLAANTTTNVQVIVQTTVAGKLTNLFTVFANETDPVLTNNSAKVISTVTNIPISTADLKLTAVATPEPVGVGNNLVYTISITNRGPNTASGVTVSNLVPASASFVSATGGSVPSGSTLLVNLGSLVAHGITNAQVIVQPGTAGKLTNLFTVFANEVDPVLTNNAATVISTVTNIPPPPPPPVDVALSIVAAPNPVNAGSPLTYSLTVTNKNSTTATGVIVSNTLPAGVTLNSVLPSQGTVTTNGNILKVAVGTLPNGTTASIAIVVTPNAAGLLTNTAIAGSVETDSLYTNNITRVITAATPAPGVTNLVLSLLSSITLNPQTGLFDLQIQVFNGGPATPSSVLVLVFGLPANAILYNASGTTNGTPYVQSVLPLPVTSNVVFTLEFYVPTRVKPTNLTFQVMAGAPVVLPVPSGTIFSVDSVHLLNDGSMLVEFSAVIGHSYAIQYSSDMLTWRTAVPAITAPATRVQWIDAGPPKTDSPPQSQPARYYRVVRIN